MDHLFTLCFKYFYLVFDFYLVGLLCYKKFFDFYAKMSHFIYDFCLLSLIWDFYYPEVLKSVSYNSFVLKFFILSL